MTKYDKQGYFSTIGDDHLGAFNLTAKTEMSQYEDAQPTLKTLGV